MEHTQVKVGQLWLQRPPSFSDCASSIDSASAYWERRELVAWSMYVITEAGQSSRFCAVRLDGRAIFNVRDAFIVSDFLLVDS